METVTYYGTFRNVNPEQEEELTKLIDAWIKRGDSNDFEEGEIIQPGDGIIQMNDPRGTRNFGVSCQQHINAHFGNFLDNNGNIKAHFIFIYVEDAPVIVEEYDYGQDDSINSGATKRCRRNACLEKKISELKMKVDILKDVDWRERMRKLEKENEALKMAMPGAILIQAGLESWISDLENSKTFEKGILEDFLLKVVNLRLDHMLRDANENRPL